jgi:hypothetical protein
MFIGGAVLFAFAGGFAVQGAFAQAPPSPATVTVLGSAPGGATAQPGAHAGCACGGSVMVDGPLYLYVLTGQRLFKVHKESFRIVTELNLRRGG